MAKVIKSNQQIRMTCPYGAAASAAASAAADLTAPAFSTALQDPSTASAKPPLAPANHLYADSTVPCFFRRPAFSPDGSLLITPAGVYRPLHPSSSSADLAAAAAAAGPSFCTHVFLRDQLQSPIVSLVGLEDPSVAVRCCPLLYQPVDHAKASDGSPAAEPLFGGTYRLRCLQLI